jgi:hypothetical protein
MNFSSDHDDIAEFDEVDPSGKQLPKMEKMTPPLYFPSFV